MNIQPNERKNAVDTLRILLTPAEKAQLRRAIPRRIAGGWENQEDARLGMRAKALLRRHGYTEHTLRVPNLADVYVDLLMEAVGCDPRQQ